MFGRGLLKEHFYKTFVKINVVEPPRCAQIGAQNPGLNELKHGGWWAATRQESSDFFFFFFFFFRYLINHMIPIVLGYL